MRDLMIHLASKSHSGGYPVQWTALAQGQFADHHAAHPGRPAHRIYSPPTSVYILFRFL